jgi:DNA-directed RNA polymerase sigma subunit (sigma70/sigma32)
LWRWFCEVVSANPLTFQELAAWSSVTKIRLRGWEAEALKSLDRLFWKVRHE